MSEQTIDRTQDPEQTVRAPRWVGLLRSEIRRARSRRSLRWMCGLVLLGVLAISAILFATTAHVDQADLDAATSRMAAETQMYYEQCMADPTIPESDKAAYCYKPTQEDVQANAIYNVSPQPFGNDSLVALLGLGGGLACVVAMLIGASAGGADWGARTMGLLFSWEPRRLRVFLTRLGVVLVIGLAITAASVALAYGLGALIASAHGLDPTVRLPADVDFAGTADLAAAREFALRWLPLGMIAAAAGFGVAMATRSTGWAIGASIALVVVAEPLVQVLWSWGSQWLVQTNAIIWMSGGMEWLVSPGAVSGSGSSEFESATSSGSIYISQWRALGVLTLMVVIVLGVAATLLRRRDVD